MKSEIKNFTVEASDNTVYQLKASLFIETKHNYGADADGNRGVTFDYIEDYAILSIKDENTEEFLDEEEIESFIKEHEDTIDTKIRGIF